MAEMTEEQALGMLPNGHTLIRIGEVIPCGDVIRILKHGYAKWEKYHWPETGGRADRNHMNWYAVKNESSRKEW